MRTYRSLAFALAAPLVLSACVAHLTPSAFAVPTERGSAPAVRRALAQQSTDIAYEDEQAGVIQTAWESTGQNSDGTIWAIRYTITLAPTAAATRVTVAMDLRTCQGLGVDHATGALDASSCPRPPEGTTPTMYQDRLDEFARALQASL